MPSVCVFLFPPTKQSIPYWLLSEVGPYPCICWSLWSVIGGFFFLSLIGIQFTIEFDSLSACVETTGAEEEAEEEEWGRLEDWTEEEGEEGDDGGAIIDKLSPLSLLSLDLMAWKSNPNISLVPAKWRQLLLSPLVSAPKRHSGLANRILATPRRFLSQAWSSGVHPWLLLELTWAQCSSSNLVKSSCPAYAAALRGLKPFLFLASLSAPLSRSRRAMPIFPR